MSKEITNRQVEISATNAIFKSNNFDAIRLIAALQVAICHTAAHLGLNHDSLYLFKLLEYFPGVPIFFFVSGYLISKSYEDNSNVREYAINRALRLYPALIACTAISILAVYIVGYYREKNISVSEFIIWVIGQVSIGQFYNPEFMRGFGTGVLNCSLWSIAVEVQFYILTPIIYWLLGLKDRMSGNIKLLILTAIFMTLNIGYGMLAQEKANSLWLKLFAVSFMPWLYMFLVGVLFQRNFEFFHRYLSGKAHFVFLSFGTFAFASSTYLGAQFGNIINPLFYFPLVITVFSCAYSFVIISKVIFSRNDISYGIYIYHMPIVNIFIYYGLIVKAQYILLALLGAAAMAIISWFVIEKRCIKLKKRPFNSLVPSPRA